MTLEQQLWSRAGARSLQSKQGPHPNQAARSLTCSRPLQPYACCPSGHSSQRPLSQGPLLLSPPSTCSPLLLYRLASEATACSWNSRCHRIVLCVPSACYACPCSCWGAARASAQSSTHSLLLSCHLGLSPANVLDVDMGSPESLVCSAPHCVPRTKNPAPGYCRCSIALYGRWMSFRRDSSCRCPGWANSTETKA